jgi:hypothetical protein
VAVFAEKPDRCQFNCYPEAVAIDEHRFSPTKKKRPPVISPGGR